MPFDATGFDETQTKVPTRAKTLDEKQFQRVVAWVTRGDNALRNLTAVYLSFYCGLRPQEIALLEWSRHVLDAGGNVGEEITITSDIGKKGVGRKIPIHPDLRRALIGLRAIRPHDDFVFHPLNPRCDEGHVQPCAVTQFFKRLYRDVGFDGCTGYSGRRTFITVRARQANLAGCSIKDVQQLAGHRKLSTTAGYIETSPQQARLTALPLR